MMDPDPDLGGPETYGSGSTTLVNNIFAVFRVLRKADKLNWAKVMLF